MNTAPDGAVFFVANRLLRISKFTFKKRSIFAPLFQITVLSLNFCYINVLSAQYIVHLHTQQTLQICLISTSQATGALTHMRRRRYPKSQRRERRTILRLQLPNIWTQGSLCLRFSLLPDARPSKSTRE